MFDVGVLLVQLGRQPFGHFLLEEFGPDPDTAADDGFPTDGVRFHKTGVRRSEGGALPDCFPGWAPPPEP